MSEIVFEGSQVFIDLGKAALDKCDPRWPDLLDADVLLSYVEAIPNAPDWAEGLWRGGQRHGFVKKQFKRDGTPMKNLAQYLTLHEGLGHPSDLDKMPGHRGKARKLMHPFPETWRDTDGLVGMESYWRYPFETYANRMVEALTNGAVRSPYDDDYTRYIKDEDLPFLLAIPLDEPVSFAVADPQTYGTDHPNDTLPDEIVEQPSRRLLEALELVRKSRRLFKEGVELTQGWQELKEDQ